MSCVRAWGIFFIVFYFNIEVQWIARLGNMSRIVMICIIYSGIHKN